MAIRKIIKRATDSLFTNPEFDGTESARQVKGTTAERTSAEAGDLRFNTTTSLMEYYDGVIWKSIDAPPIISSISPSNIADSDSSVDIVITGSNFSTSPTVTAIGQDASVITPTTVVRDSITQITATFDGTDFLDAQEDYDIKVENVSGLSNTLADALAVNASPVWTTSAGNIAEEYINDSVSTTVVATDDEGATLTYSLSSGSLPSNLSLNSGTGEITGTLETVPGTTTQFTLSASDGTNTTNRVFNIISKSGLENNSNTIAYFDFADNRSWGGNTSTTTWEDLTSNNNDISRRNGTSSYSSSNGGTLTTSNFSAWSGTGISAFDNTGKDFSMGVWVKFSSQGSGSKGIIGIGDTDSNDHFYLRDNFGNGYFNPQVGLDNDSGTDAWHGPCYDGTSNSQYNFITGQTDYLNKYFLYVLHYDHSSDNVYLSINGSTFYSCIGNVHFTPETGGARLSIGGDGYNDNYSAFSYGGAWFYNGAVSQTDVNNEWNRYRTRFGW